MPTETLFNMFLFYALMLYVLASVLVLWYKPAAWLHLLTLFLGLLVGWFDLRATEVSMSALMLLAFGFFAGFAQPKRAWLWGLYLGIWIPVLGFLASFGKSAGPSPAALLTALPALLFAFGGSALGLVVRRIAARESSIQIPE